MKKETREQRESIKKALKKYRAAILGEYWLILKEVNKKTRELLEKGVDEEHFLYLSTIEDKKNLYSGYTTVSAWKVEEMHKTLNMVLKSDDKNASINYFLKYSNVNNNVIKAWKKENTEMKELEREIQELRNIKIWIDE